MSRLTWDENSIKFYTTEWLKLNVERRLYIAEAKDAALKTYHDQAGKMLSMDILTDLQMSARRGDENQELEANANGGTKFFESFKKYNIPISVPILCPVPRIIQDNGGHQLATVKAQVYCIGQICKA